MVETENVTEFVTHKIRDIEACLAITAFLDKIAQWIDTHDRLMSHAHRFRRYCLHIREGRTLGVHLSTDDHIGTVSISRIHEAHICNAGPLIDPTLDLAHERTLINPALLKH